MPDRAAVAARWLADESFWMRGVGRGQNIRALRAHDFGAAVMNVSRRVQASAGVTVVVVVPGKEALTETVRILLGPEAVGELGPVLERLELRLAEGIVIRAVRMRVRLGHPQVGEQEGNWLGAIEEPRSA